MTEREEQNWKIAEWLKFRTTSEIDDGHQFITWHAPACRCSADSPEAICSCLDLCDVVPPDFFEDEKASAMAVEKARFAVVPGYLYTNGILVDEQLRWFVGPNPEHSSRVLDIHPLTWDVDRKTAIAMAVLHMLKEK